MKLKTIVNLYDELNRANFAGRLERPTVLLTRRWVHGDYAYGGNSDRVVMRFNPADDKGLRQMRAMKIRGNMTMNSTILNVIGGLMLALPFFLFYVMIILEEGLRTALGIFFFVIALFLWMGAGVYFIGLE
jgi:hypothetical protein